MADRLITHHFQTPPRWGSGHLQTLRSRVVRRHYDLLRFGSQRSALVDLGDDTGDKLVVQLHRHRRLNSSRQPRPDSGSGGLVLLVHGLGGSVESDYMRATTLGLLRAGFNVARVDLRSAGESGKTSALQYHAGRTQDLRAVLRQLATEPQAVNDRSGKPELAVIGFSLGGNMTIKLMGEPHGGLPLFGAVAVSAPLDLLVGSVHLRKIAFGAYERFLLAELKRQSLTLGPDGEPRVTTTERQAIRRARSLVDFDDAMTAPRNGWRNAAEYYERNSSGKFLDKVAAPTLIIHSVDDPMIPVMPYRAIDWGALESAGLVQRAITARGGHVGFHERGNPLPWFVGQSVRFLSDPHRLDGYTPLGIH